MFKKQYYGSKIAPACAYCLYGMPASDPKMVLCRFCYDPLMRVPHRQVLPELDPKDFTLE